MGVEVSVRLSNWSDRIRIAFLALARGRFTFPAFALQDFRPLTRAEAEALVRKYHPKE
jgi:hypothetical protein